MPHSPSRKMPGLSWRGNSSRAWMIRIMIEEELERLWALEAEDRVAAFERGEIEAAPVEEVLASLKHRGRNAT